MVRDIRDSLSYKRIRRAYLFYFSRLAFFALWLLLLCAFLADVRGHRAFSLGLCGIGVACFAVYYSIYALRFGKLTSLTGERGYYYDIYTLWGVAFFNLLFLVLFSLFLFQLNGYFGFLSAPAPFGALSVLGLSFEAILDDLSLGFLSSFGFRLVSVDYAPRFFWHGALLYGFKLIINVALIASVFAEIRRRIELRSELRRLSSDEYSTGSVFEKMDPLKEKWLLKALRSDAASGSFRRNALALLHSRDGMDVKDAVLEILSKTRDLGEFDSCLDYFRLHQDSRFPKVIRRIRDAGKRERLVSRGLLTKTNS